MILKRQMSATVGIRTRVASLEGLNPNQLDYGCNKRMYLSGLYNVYWQPCVGFSDIRISVAWSPVHIMQNYVHLTNPNMIELTVNNVQQYNKSNQYGPTSNIIIAGYSEKRMMDNNNSQTNNTEIIQVRLKIIG